MVFAYYFLSFTLCAGSLLEKGGAPEDANAERPWPLSQITVCWSGALEGKVNWMTKSTPEFLTPNFKKSMCCSSPQPPPLLSELRVKSGYGFPLGLSVIPQNRDRPLKTQDSH